MNPEVQLMLERQDVWQKARRHLSWPEKIRMAEVMRDAALQLRKPLSHPGISAPQNRRDG